ncbi:MAG: hypothetical protein ACLU4N_22845 [Butyricimonas faecihominis]
MDYYPSLISFACYYVEEVVAEDLVQDVFVKMWEQRGDGAVEIFRLMFIRWCVFGVSIITWGEVEGRDDAFV